MPADEQSIVQTHGRLADLIAIELRADVRVAGGGGLKRLPRGVGRNFERQRMLGGGPIFGQFAFALPIEAEVVLRRALHEAIKPQGDGAKLMGVEQHRAAAEAEGHRVRILGFAFHSHFAAPPGAKTIFNCSPVKLGSASPRGAKGSAV